MLTLFITAYSFSWLLITLIVPCWLSPGDFCLCDVFCFAVLCHLIYRSADFICICLYLHLFDLAISLLSLSAEYPHVKSHTLEIAFTDYSVLSRFFFVSCIIRLLYLLFSYIDIILQSDVVFYLLFGAKKICCFPFFFRATAVSSFHLYLHPTFCRNAIFHPEIFL